MIPYQWRPSLRTDILIRNCARMKIPPPLIARTFHEGSSVNTGADQAYSQYGTRKDIRLLIDVFSDHAQYDVNHVPVLRLGTNNTSFTRARFDNLYFSDDITIIIAFIPRRQTAGKDVTLFGKWNTGGAPGTNEWWVGLNATGDGIDWHFGWSVESSSTSTLIKDPALWTANQRYVLGCARKRSSGEMALYKDGIIVNGTAAAVTGAINNVRTQIDFGCLQGGAAFNAQVDYELVMIWDNALPLRSIRDLSINPYQLWVPPTSRTFPSRSTSSPSSGNRQALMRGVGRGLVRGLR